MNSASPSTSPILQDWETLERGRRFARMFGYWFVTGMAAATATLAVIIYVRMHPGIVAPIDRFLSARPRTLGLAASIAYLLLSRVAHRWASTEHRSLAQRWMLAGFAFFLGGVFIPVVELSQWLNPAFVFSFVILTAVGFTTLTALAVLARTEFSPVEYALATGIIIASVFTALTSFSGIQTPIVFAAVGVTLVCCYIVRAASMIAPNSGDGQHIAAAIRLLAAFAMPEIYLRFRPRSSV